MYYNNGENMRLKPITQICIVLSMLALPVMAATNDTFTMPSFSDGWKDTPSAVQSGLYRILGWGFVLVVVSAILFVVIKGGTSLWAHNRGDVSGKSDSMTDMFKGVVVIIAVILIPVLILYLVS